jgi:hypothetical protein
VQLVDEAALEQRPVEHASSELQEVDSANV